MEKLVSIIIPIYNKEPYLKKCLNSILEQSYKNIEILLIDDGSTDKGLDICNEFVEKDKRFKYFYKENGGVSSARNYGIDKSSGYYLTFVDADDYIDTDFIERLIENESDLVVCGYKYVHSDIIIDRSSVEEILDGRENISNKILSPEYRELLKVPYLKLYKSAIIKENNIKFNIAMNYGEDTLFVLEYILKCKNIKFIKYNGYNNLVVEGTLSRKYVKNIIEQLMIVNSQISKYDNTQDKSYWYTQYLKTIINNEKNLKYKNFKKNIMEALTEYKNLNFIIENKYNSTLEKIIVKCLKFKLFGVVYIMYKIKK